MRDGTIAPEDVHVEGVDTPEEAARKEVRKLGHCEFII
jgi:hypothetical protein